MVGIAYYLRNKEIAMLKELLEKEVRSNKEWYNKLKGWQQSEADVFYERYILAKELNDELEIVKGDVI